MPRFTELTVASTVGQNDIIPLVQNGVTLSTTAGAIAALGSGAAGAVNEPRYVYFDEFFATGGGGNIAGPGGTDAEKAAAMSTWLQNNTGSGPRKSVLYGARNYSMPTLPLWSGQKHMGVAPVREYNTGTTWTCAGTNQWSFPGGVNNGGYSYPAGGAPRDIHLENILFAGGSTKNWLAPQATYTAANVLWMSTIHNCGWTNWLTIIKGYLDGVTLSGVTHIQGCYDTPFTLGGSENNIFGDGFAFMDSAAAYSIVTGGKPFIDTHMDKSRIGRIMVTSRQTGYALLVSGGSNQVIDGFAADAQATDPTYGAAVKVTGGDGTVFTNCSFKGMATNPASAVGGLAANRGWIHVTGGSHTIFNGCNWQRSGNSQPLTSFPMVFAGPSVGAGQVKIGLGNGWTGYGGANGLVQQSTAGQIQTSTDTTLTLTTGA